jgi:hypothetical protein
VKTFVHTFTPSFQKLSGELLICKHNITQCGRHGLKDMVSELKSGGFDGVEASLGDVDNMVVR